MLKGTLEYKRYTAAATDGEAGRIDDMYMHQGQWLIRYLLLKAAFEPEGRRVLIGTQSVRRILHDEHRVTLNLAHEEIRNSPDVDVSQPVSKQHEVDLNTYYGWPADWLQEEHDITPTGELSGRPEDENDQADARYTGPQMQSCNELIGLFHVQTNEADLGKIADLIVEDETWLIPYMAVEFVDSPTGYVLLPTDMIESVDWTDAHVYVDASLDFIQAAPTCEPGEPLTDEQQQQLKAGARAHR